MKQLRKQRKQSSTTPISHIPHPPCTNNMRKKEKNQRSIQEGSHIFHLYCYTD